jgi:predicted TPR repeat methyltransferase
LAGSGRSYDLLFAADVFVYVGALEEVFQAAAAAIEPAGMFCFSVEAAQAQDLELRSTLRYAHSEHYVRDLADRSGFAVTRCVRQVLRTDQEKPIEGILFWLQAPSRPGVER